MVAPDLFKDCPLQVDHGIPLGLAVADRHDEPLTLQVFEELRGADHFDGFGLVDAERSAFHAGNSARRAEAGEVVHEGILPYLPAAGLAK